MYFANIVAGRVNRLQLDLMIVANDDLRLVEPKGGFGLVVADLTGDS
jgi:hypothetical protein